MPFRALHVQASAQAVAKAHVYTFRDKNADKKSHSPAAFHGSSVSARRHRPNIVAAIRLCMLGHTVRGRRSFRPRNPQDSCA